MSAENLNPSGLLQRKLLIVSGKGGVGKTTVSAVLARLATRLGKRTLVIQSDPNVDAPVTLPTLLDAETFGNQEKELHPNLWALKSDPENAMRYSLMTVIRSKFLYNRFFQSELVREIVAAVPGLREAFIMYHVHALAAYGSRRRHYDLVIWDAPPTGHLPLYLKSPEILSKMFLKSYVGRVTHGLADSLRQPDQVLICLVTLPEETPVSETLQLIRRLRAENLGHPGCIIVNNHPSPLFDPEELQDYRAFMADPGPRERFHAWCNGAGLPDALLTAALRRKAWEGQAQEIIRPLADQGVPLWTLPPVPAGRIGLAEVDQAAAAWLDDPTIRRYLERETVTEVVHT